MLSVVGIRSEAWPVTELSGEHEVAMALGRGLTWGQGSLLCTCWDIHKVPGGSSLGQTAPRQAKKSRKGVLFSPSFYLLYIVLKKKKMQ